MANYLDIQGDEPLCLNGEPLENAIPFFDWDNFFHRWNMGGADGGDDRGEARRALHTDAQSLLAEIVSGKLLELRGVVRFLPALSHNETVFLFEKRPGVPVEQHLAAPCAQFIFPRCRRLRHGRANPCLADFVLPRESAAGRFDAIGLFALSAGFGLERAAGRPDGADSYRAILAGILAGCLAEAWSACVHKRLCKTGIRPAFGYPCCPNHEDKRVAFKLLNAETLCGMALTESAMIHPAASICGMYFLNPQSFYFNP
ncbi:MAG: hypothetical protein LBG74_08345 [Spirochaetaceae bacterium]|jgi:5-methyltetrahydrofolate--homocysteine methyltransferase|nr:hypothetical protein [Spirochaetaceae bacterium]